MVNASDADAPLLQMKCPCGLWIREIGEDALVDAARQHLREAHPEKAEAYTRDEILYFAYMS